MSSAPEWFVAVLVRAIQTSPRERQPALVRALGSVRTLQSARELLDIAESVGSPSPAPPEAVNAAWDALARLTGRADLPREPAPWRALLASFENAGPGAWSAALTDALAARVDAETREHERVVGRLVDELRRGFSADSGAEARSERLVSFLADDLDEVRALGFTLALQELANARPLDARVAEAAIPRLRDARASSRRSAAELLNVLAPEKAKNALQDALAIEPDPMVAESLLRSAVRWPSERSRELVLRWLDRSLALQHAGTHTRALEACVALLDAGLLDVEGDKARVLAGVREQVAGDTGQQVGGASASAATRLAFSLGDAEARRDIIESLRSADTDRALRIAEAIVPDARSVDPLLEIARARPGVYPFSAESIKRHRRTASGFSQLVRLTPPSVEVGRQALVSLGALLSPGDLVVVARELPDLSLREAILARLTSEPSPVRFGLEGMSLANRGPSRATHQPGVVAGLRLLCRTRLELGQPAAALKAIEALGRPDAGRGSARTGGATPVGVDAGLGTSPGSTENEREDIDNSRTVALIWLNRLDEAQSTRGSMDAWVEGLERCAQLPHAPQVLRIIDTRYGQELPEQLAIIVAGYRERFRMSVGPSPLP